MNRYVNELAGYGAGFTGFLPVLSGSTYTIEISQAISSGSPVDGVATYWSFYPSGRCGAMAGVIDIYEGEGLWSGGIHSVTVSTNVEGLFICEDQATGERYFIGKFTPS